MKIIWAGGRGWGGPTKAFNGADVSQAVLRQVFGLREPRMVPYATRAVRKIATRFVCLHTAK